MVTIFIVKNWYIGDKTSHLYSETNWHLSSCFYARRKEVGLVVKNPPDNPRDIREPGLIPGWGRSPGGGHGNPLQYSCLENPMDRGAWGAVVHRVTKSWTWLKPWSSIHIFFRKCAPLPYTIVFFCVCVCVEGILRWFLFSSFVHL